MFQFQVKSHCVVLNPTSPCFPPLVYFILFLLPYDFYNEVNNRWYRSSNKNVLPCFLGSFKQWLVPMTINDPNLTRTRMTSTTEKNLTIIIAHEFFNSTVFHISWFFCFH